MRTKKSRKPVKKGKKLGRSKLQRVPTLRKVEATRLTRAEDLGDIGLARASRVSES